jgi:hypothetical protein
LLFRRFHLIGNAKELLHVMTDLMSDDISLRAMIMILWTWPRHDLKVKRVRGGVKPLRLMAARRLFLAMHAGRGAEPNQRREMSADRWLPKSLAPDLDAPKATVAARIHVG